MKNTTSSYIGQRWATLNGRKQVCWPTDATGRFRNVFSRQIKANYSKQSGYILIAIHISWIIPPNTQFIHYPTTLNTKFQMKIGCYLFKAIAALQDLKKII